MTYICNKSHLKCTFPTGLKFSALKSLHKKGEEWKSSVGPIMWETKKYYLESRSRGINNMKSVNGSLTGLVTFCAETAFYYGLLEER